MLELHKGYTPNHEALPCPRCWQATTKAIANQDKCRKPLIRLKTFCLTFSITKVPSTILLIHQGRGYPRLSHTKLSCCPNTPSLEGWCLEGHQGSQWKVTKPCSTLAYQVTRAQCIISQSSKTLRPNPHRDEKWGLSWPWMWSLYTWEVGWSVDTIALASSRLKAL